MSMDRRDAVKLLGLAAAATTFGFGCAERETQRAVDAVSLATQPSGDYERQFFTDAEYETVRMLAEMTIPADERSGGAIDAGVPAFVDFTMADDLVVGGAQRRTAMRGGLAWLDYQCLERFNALFAACSDAQRREMLDLIAYPNDAPPEMQPGVEFFSSFRDLVAAGYFSSMMGVEDLQYLGNTGMAEWPGCPDEVLQHVSLHEAT